MDLRTQASLQGPLDPVVQRGDCGAACRRDRRGGGERWRAWAVEQQGPGRPAEHGLVEASCLRGPGAQTPTGGLGGCVAGLVCAHGKDVRIFTGVVDYYFSVTVPRPLFLETVPLADLSAFSAASLERWGVAGGCRDQFDSTFCERVRQEASAALQREAEGAFGRLRGVVAACTRGEVGGLDDVLLQSLLKPLPGNCPVTAVVSDFLQARSLLAVATTLACLRLDGFQIVFVFVCRFRFRFPLSCVGEPRGSL